MTKPLPKAEKERRKLARRRQRELLSALDIISNELVAFIPARKVKPLSKRETQEFSDWINGR